METIVWPANSAENAKSYEYDFRAAVSGSVDTDFLDILSSGAGMALSQSSGKLYVAMGTTANAQTLLRSKVSFSRELLFAWAASKTQAIANQTCQLMLADNVGDGLSAVASSATALAVTIPASNPSYALLAEIGASGLVGMKMWTGALSGITGIPGQYAIASATDTAGVSMVLNFTVSGWTIGSGTVSLFGWNAIYVYYTPATATTMVFDTVRNGWPSLLGEVAYTINTVTSGHAGVLYKNAEAAVLSDMALASLAAPAPRASRFNAIPAEAKKLYLYIMAQNGSTAPASTTTWALTGIRIEESSAQPVGITSIKLQNAGISALPVYFQATPSVVISGNPVLGAGTAAIGDAGGTVRAGAGGLSSNNRLLSAAATTNATSVKASAGRLYKIRGQNASASVRWLKLYNKATAPTVGTDTPVYTFALAASSVIDIDFGLLGLYFSTGIAFALTTGSADNDTGALTAGDVLGLNSMYA
jgi:hypothetical protein